MIDCKNTIQSNPNQANFCKSNGVPLEHGPLDQMAEAVNTVCLGFSDEFIEFSQSWFYRWFLAKITDFGGEDQGFLAKITDFWRRLRIFR